MKPEDITSEDFLEVCKLYGKHLGRRRGLNRLEEDAGRWVMTIKNKGFLDDMRIGSRYDHHTKLCFTKDPKTGEVRPRINLNFHPSRREGKRYEEAQAAVEDFIQEAIEYLSG